MYGKVRNVIKTINENQFIVSYLYDAAGNRILKRVLEDGVEQKTTAHTRDASGNVMQTAITKIDTTEYEYPLYGSSRLGMYRGGTDPLHRALGNKHYELSNHLGNVLAVVSDARLGEDSTSNGQYDYYLPHIVSLSDYYPFGLGMKGREYKSSEYRYGFNGKENDRDFGNKQIIQDYGFRVYNPSIGKFLSVDPLTAEYPWYTPYQFAGNKPIWAADLDGLEEDIKTDKEQQTNITYSISRTGLASSHTQLSVPVDGDIYYFSGIKNPIVPSRKSARQIQNNGKVIQYFPKGSNMSIPIRFQDPKTGFARMTSGFIEGSSSDFGGSALPLIDQLQFFEKQDILNIVEGKAPSFDILYPPQTDVSSIEGTDNEVIKTFMDEVFRKNFDPGTELSESKMYIVNMSNIEHKELVNWGTGQGNSSGYYALDAKNMGNFLFGVAYQRLGIDVSQGTMMANAYEITKRGNLDAPDDQAAIRMGYAYAQHHFGKAAKNRSAAFLSAAYEFYKSMGNNSSTE